MAAMDAIAIGRIVPESETDSDAAFSVVSVLHGDKLVRESQELRVNYFGRAKTEQNPRIHRDKARHRQSTP